MKEIIYKKHHRSIYKIYKNDKLVKQFSAVDFAQRYLVSVGIEKYFGLENYHGRIVCSFGNYKVLENDVLIPVSKGYEIVFLNIISKNKNFFEKLPKIPDSDKKAIVKLMARQLGIKSMTELADVLDVSNTATIYF